MSIEDLPALHVKPPKLVKKRGRPRTKRIRKNRWKRKPQKCSNCFGLGHNKRRCTNQPGRKNGRGERARDLALNLTLISTPLPSGIMSFTSSSLSSLSLDEEEEAGSQAKSTDLELESTSGKVTDESMATKGVAIGKKRGRAVTTARALPARERKLPARYR